MNRKEALDLILAHSCCQNAFGSKEMCLICPYNAHEKCKNTIFTQEEILEAVSLVRKKKLEKKNLSEIKVRKSFENSVPNETKINKYRKYFEETGDQYKPIELDDRGYIVDGYIQYLVLKENGIEVATIMKKYERESYRNKPTTYVYGIHPNVCGIYQKEKKQYIWRIPEDKKDILLDLLPGDTVVVQTVYGNKVVTVTKIEEHDRCPVDFVVRKVLHKNL